MAATGGQTVSILAGTYKESDIVIDRPLTLQGATSTTNPGPSQTLVNLVTIEPDVASVHGDATFPSGSHQGIIVNSPSVTVQSLTIDGNGNGSLAGSFNYQAGITTLFDMQAGGDYLAEHNQTGPGAGPGPGGSIPVTNLVTDAANVNIVVQGVTVNNTWLHGIALSAPSGTTYSGMVVQSVSSGTDVEEATTVNNVGDTNINPSYGLTTYGIGIMMQNAEDHNASHDLTAISAINGVSVTGTGVGISTSVFGTASFGSEGAARNIVAMLGDTVTNATAVGYSLSNQEVDIIGGPPPVLIGFHGNTATWDNSHLNNSAIGMYMNGVQTIIGGTTITHAKIGIEVQNSSFSAFSANTSLPIPIVPVIAAAMNITGPGTGVAGSVGILAENSAAQPDSTSLGLSAGVTVSGFQTGMKVDQTAGQDPALILCRAPSTRIAPCLPGMRPALFWGMARC